MLLLLDKKTLPTLPHGDQKLANLIDGVSSIVHCLFFRRGLDTREISANSARPIEAKHVFRPRASTSIRVHMSDLEAMHACNKIRAGRCQAASTFFYMKLTQCLRKDRRAVSRYIRMAVALLSELII